MMTTEVSNNISLFLNPRLNDDLTRSSLSHHHQAVSQIRGWFTSSFPTPPPPPCRINYSEPRVTFDLIGPRLPHAVESVSLSVCVTFRLWALRGQGAHLIHQRKVVEEMNGCMGEKNQWMVLFSELQILVATCLRVLLECLNSQILTKSMNETYDWVNKRFSSWFQFPFSIQQAEHHARRPSCVVLPGVMESRSVGKLTAISVGHNLESIPASKTLIQVSVCEHP